MIEEKPTHISVKITPNKQKNQWSKTLETNNVKTYKIHIAAPPSKGKANKALTQFLSKELKLPKQNITIISGQNSPLKLIKLTWT